MNDTIDFEALAAPFPSDRISWRVGATSKAKDKGLALAYIDQRDVYARLDAVCGPARWSNDHKDAGDGRLAGKIGIDIKGDGVFVWKSDGAGSRQASKGLSEQDANKGDFSDATKRAGVAWGIGRYLYEMPPVWVLIDQYKKIKDSQYAKLTTAHEKIAGEYIPKNKEARDLYNEIMAKVASFDSLNDLGRWWLDAETQRKVRLMPTSWRQDVEHEKNEQKVILSDKQAGLAIREKATA